MSILLGLYSGLSLEHKGQWEALNVCTLSSTDIGKFCLFFFSLVILFFLPEQSVRSCQRVRCDLYIMMSEISSGWYLNIQEKETRCVQGQMNVFLFPPFCPLFITTSSIFFKQQQKLANLHLFLIYFTILQPGAKSASRAKDQPLYYDSMSFFIHYFLFLLFVLTVGHWILI